MRFEFVRTILDFNQEKNILICHLKNHPPSKLWVKKLPDVQCIASIKEDEDRYYVACEYSNTDGIFLALNKETGNTVWYIPGRSLLQVVYKRFLYLIFIDEHEEFHFIKVKPHDGRKVWHHRIDNDLQEYVFSQNTLTLLYQSGKKEILSLEDGRLL